MSDLRCRFCLERVDEIESVEYELRELRLGAFKVDDLHISVDCGRCGGSNPHMCICLDLVAVSASETPNKAKRLFEHEDQVLHPNFGYGRVERVGLAPLITVRFRDYRSPITLNERDLVLRTSFCGGER